MAELRGLEELGQMGEVFRRATELAIEAEDLGDRYGTVVAALHIATSGVAVDRPDESRARLHAALARWSREGFLLQHLYAARAEVYADLYQGRAAEAWQRVQDAWPRIENAFFLRTPITRIDSRLMRARTRSRWRRTPPAARTTCFVRARPRRDCSRRSTGPTRRRMQRRCARASRSAAIASARSHSSTKQSRPTKELKWLSRARVRIAAVGCSAETQRASGKSRTPMRISSPRA